MIKEKPTLSIALLPDYTLLSVSKLKSTRPSEAAKINLRNMLCIVSNKNIDTVQVPKMCTHDLIVEVIRACIDIFGVLSVSIYLKLTLQSNSHTLKYKVNQKYLKRLHTVTNRVAFT